MKKEIKFGIFAFVWTMLLILNISFVLPLHTHDKPITILYGIIGFSTFIGLLTYVFTIGTTLAVTPIIKESSKNFLKWFLGFFVFAVCVNLTMYITKGHILQFDTNRCYMFLTILFALVGSLQFLKEQK